MDIDAKTRRQGEFPADQPLEALRADHAIARELFERYFQTQDRGDKKSIGARILALLEMHTTLEESVFYPGVRNADPSLIERCAQDHDEAKQLIEQLALMNDGQEQADRMFRQLADAILAHVDLEEQQLFPKVEQAGLDLGALGHEMQACELRLIADRAQRPTAPGVRL